MTLDTPGCIALTVGFILLAVFIYVPWDKVIRNACCGRKE